jgi:hypothetical protein
MAIAVLNSLSAFHGGGRADLLQLLGNAEVQSCNESIGDERFYLFFAAACRLP